MKKTLLLLSILTLCTIANAQRIVNLSVAITNPTNNQNVIEMQPFTVDILVKNVGTTPVKITDSFALYLLLNGSPFQFVVNGQLSPFKPYDTHPLNPNDSFTISMQQVFTSSIPLGHSTLCIKILPYNGSADSVKDTLVVNNTSCVVVNIQDSSVGIAQLGGGNLSNTISTYPNPAKSAVHFNLFLQETGSVAINIYDISGRLVKTSLSTQFKGESSIKMDMSDLTPGIYYYNAVLAGTPYNGKILIDR